VMQSWIFTVITPVFSVTWSFWNPSRELFLEETFLIIINVKKTVVLHHIFMEHTHTQNILNCNIYTFFTVFW